MQQHPLSLCLFLQGLNFLIPILDRIRYVQSLKEIVIDIPEQSSVSLGKNLYCFGINLYDHLSV